MAFLPPIHSFPALISALLMSLAISGCQTDIDVPPDESVVPGNSANEASEQETNEQEESSAEDGSTADANNSDGAADTDDSATNTDDSATTESSTSESPDTSDSSEATDDTNSETNDETVADANDETTGDETTDDETTDDETTGDETSGDESSDDTPSSSETANDDLAEDETTTAANDEEEPVVLLTLSGTLSASDGVILDLDINDANAGLGDNNDPANAQVLASTAVVLGFATAHATEGEISDEPDSENFARIADVDDYFLVALEAGQIIRLDIADSGTMPNGDKYLGDLDLYLFAASDDSALLYRSNGTGNQELIQVTEAGNYLVNVNAFSGASNYRLTLMPATSTSAASAADDFASNQVLVRPVSISLPFGSSKEQVRQSYSTRAIEAVQSLSGQSNGAQILAQKPLGQRFTLMTLSAPLSAQQDPLQAFNATIYEKRTTLQQVKQLAQVADIAIAEPNYYRQALAIPRDTYYGYQWSLPAIELPGAWDYSEGDDVIVAVIDSGVHLAHPELSGQLLPGYDFISSAYNSNDGDGIDSNPNDPGDSTQPGYSSWHGTHVSGIIAAASNNNSGIAGIAPNSQIMPLRALGLYGGTSSDILQALYYAAGMVNASGTVPARRADIINLSLGGESWSSIEQEAYQDVEDAGVIMVAAAGNSASTVPMYPASYSSVLSVSAVDAEDELADYSNRGAYIDIAAPGGDVSADRNFDSQPDGILSLFVDDLSGNQRATY
ncbi:MAG: S8 family serine peptidase, partial [Oceanobacter sp.]